MSVNAGCHYCRYYFLDFRYVSCLQFDNSHEARQHIKNYGLIGRCNGFIQYEVGGKKQRVDMSNSNEEVAWRCPPKTTDDDEPHGQGELGSASSDIGWEDFLWGVIAILITITIGVGLEFIFH